MTNSSEDERKKFIISTAAHYFNMNLPSDGAGELLDNKSLNEFLDNGTCLILCISNYNSSSEEMLMENKISLKEDKPLLIFFKICADVITEENMHKNIFISSIAASPISSFYHILEKVFSPILLKNNEWSQKFDPKLQGLISELESGLRLALGEGRTEDRKNVFFENTTVIMNPLDEVAYWASVANTATRRDLRERSTAFWNALEPLGNDLKDLDSHSLTELDDILETVHNSLDDLWKLDEYPYPQDRMEHLLTVTDVRCMKLLLDNNLSPLYVEN